MNKVELTITGGTKAGWHWVLEVWHPSVCIRADKYDYVTTAGARRAAKNVARKFGLRVTATSIYGCSAEPEGEPT